jgi:hypothetical protein
MIICTTSESVCTCCYISTHSFITQCRSTQKHHNAIPYAQHHGADGLANHCNVSSARSGKIIIAVPNQGHVDRVLSILETLPSPSNRPCALDPFSFAVLLRADRDAASICCLVCWCIVLVYAERENCPSISYSCAGN